MSVTTNMPFTLRNRYEQSLWCHTVGGAKQLCREIALQSFESSLLKLFTYVSGTNSPGVLCADASVTDAFVTRSTRHHSLFLWYSALVIWHRIHCVTLSMGQSFSLSIKKPISDFSAFCLAVLLVQLNNTQLIQLYRIQGQ